MLDNGGVGDFSGAREKRGWIQREIEYIMGWVQWDLYRVTVEDDWRRNVAYIDELDCNWIPAIKAMWLKVRAGVSVKWFKE